MNSSEINLNLFPGSAFCVGSKSGNFMYVVIAKNNNVITTIVSNDLIDKGVRIIRFGCTIINEIQDRSEFRLICETQ